MSMKNVLSKDQEGVIIQVGDEYLVVTAYNKDSGMMQAKLCSNKEEAIAFAEISEEDMSPGDTSGMH